ncbi:hypothetical protein STRUR_1235 [Streptococcus urinalis 2285-97]|uniref:Uncharacterized protein n=1 Tax=Streptococcus urinalis 2285-97 TaxID=764291 RepID=G5KG74_9STRE|nr:hypothetical protein STRUR_1235 [Streptococcus urinalis 2285-97]
MQATLFRNIKDLTISILDEQKNLVWESSSKEKQYRKNFNADLRSGLGHYDFSFSTWDGKDFNGNDVKNGLYNYQVSYRPVSPDAQVQKLSFWIRVHNEAPKLAQLKAIEVTKEAYIVTVENAQPYYRNALAFHYDVDEEGLIYKESRYFYADKNGKIKVPKVLKQDEKVYQVELSQLLLITEDLSGNYQSQSLQSLIDKQKQDVESPQKLMSMTMITKMTKNEVSYNQIKETISEKERSQKYLRQLNPDIIPSQTVFVSPKANDSHRRKASHNNNDFKTSIETKLMRTDKQVLPKSGDRQDSLLKISGILMSLLSLTFIKKIKLKKLK